MRYIWKYKVPRDEIAISDSKNEVLKDSASNVSYEIKFHIVFSVTTRILNEIQMQNEKFLFHSSKHKFVHIPANIMCFSSWFLQGKKYVAKEMNNMFPSILFSGRFNIVL